MTLTNDTQTIDAEALRARLAETPASDAVIDLHPAAAECIIRTRTERDAARAEIDRLRAALAVTQRAREETEDASEVDYLDALLARQHAILTGVANALRGDPGPLASHSHHDLAERAAAMVALLAVTQASLEAASSGRRVTVVDEVERLQRERDALRDAARECLDALEAPAPVWDADESEHDGHAARLEVARGALRTLVAPR